MKVSIIIPTYNRAGYLREALQSALFQTHSDIEVIVLDDASPDDTPVVMAQFAQDPRVRYIRHEKNLGIARNWRAGLVAVTGDFFCLLHDDDTLETHFVERLIQPLINDKGLILAFCDHWIMDANGKRLIKASEDTYKRFHRDLLAEGPLPDFAVSALVDLSVPVGATLFRRSMVVPEFINEQAKGSIDVWLFYQCVRTGCGAYYIAERLMNYRSHAGGMSASAPLYMAEGHLFRYQQILADPEMAALRTVIRRMMSVTLTDYGIGLLASGRHLEARRSLEDSLRIHVSGRGLAAYALALGGSTGTRLTEAIRQLRRRGEQRSSPEPRSRG